MDPQHPPRRLRRATAAALALLALALSAPGAASADLTRDSLTIAERLFPGSPCAGKATVRYIPDFNAWASRLRPDRAAAGIWGMYVRDTPCVLYIDPDIPTRAGLCRTIVHEYGHGAMTGTDADHASHAGEGAMLDDGTTPAACAALGQEAPNVDGRDRNLRRRDAMWAVWNLYRGRVRSSLVSCVPEGAVRGFGVPWICDVFRSRRARRQFEPSRTYIVRWDVRRQKILTTRFRESS